MNVPITFEAQPRYWCPDCHKSTELVVCLSCGQILGVSNNE